MRVIGLCAFALFWTPALAAKREEPKLVAAREASIALAAPAVCPNLKVDDEALTAYLAQAEVAESDLAGRFRTPTQAAVRAFEQAARATPEEACSDVMDRLGDDGLGLLHTGSR